MGANAVLGKLVDFTMRQAKAKDTFVLKEISKSEAYDFVKTYHYLGDARFFSVYSIGMFVDDDLVGVATYSLPQGNVALKGWFGLPNTNKDIVELSRLCMIPFLNGSNATSYLLSNSMKLIKREHGIRAVITLADSSRHVGSIYQVCNFKYYGLTDVKKDFYKYVGGEVSKNPRGATKGVKGVWTPRPRKHRYAFIMDKNLKCLYEQVTPYPRPLVATPRGDCNLCDGTHRVKDNRLGDTYSCPECTGRLYLV